MSSTNDQTFRSWEDAVSWLVEQPEQQQLVHECYFDRPVADAVRRYAASTEWQELQANWIPSRGGVALDIGAGNGLVSYALASAGWSVVALEPDPGLYVGAGAIAAIAEEAALPIRPVRGFAESLPFPAASFDMVIARQVLHHAADLPQMCAEFSRVLRPGGSLIAFRDHVVDSDAGLATFRNEHPLHNLYGGENAFPLREYTAAIERAGLTIDRVGRQFDTVVNFAPRTEEELSGLFAEKLPSRRLQQIFLRAMDNTPVRRTVLKAAARVDRRPGRTVAFACSKAGTNAS